MRILRNLFFNFTSNFSLLISFFLTTLYLLLATFSSAQTPEWVYQYVNPELSEWPTTIVADSSGNSYVTGLLARGVTGGIGIIKLDSEGTER